MQFHFAWRRLRFYAGDAWHYVFTLCCSKNVLFKEHPWSLAILRLLHNNPEGNRLDDEARPSRRSAPW